MKSNLKTFLILITTFAVVSDSMLIPFYPQFFKAAFSVTDPQHVGLYLAASCFAVMFAFPAWAHVAKKIPALQLLIYTQLAAGILSVMCYWAESILVFWVISLSMIVFKGSYLLIYPFIMTLEDKTRHGGTIGLLSVIVHFGAILGALLGGLVLELYEPRQAFLVMAVGDFLQMAVCMALVRQEKREVQSGTAEPEMPGTAELPVPANNRFLYKLSFIMLIFYFSAYLIRPFFAVYWESISVFKGEIAAGIVFSVPAFMALLALWFNHRQGSREDAYDRIIPAFLWGSLGLLLQAAPYEVVVFIGRCVFGWALFQSTVYLDLLVFKLSTPQSYATDFSIIHFFQNLGVLIASYAAGWMVSVYGLPAPFLAGAAGLMATLVCYQFLFKTPKEPEEEAAQA